MKRVLITGADSYIGTSVETWLKQWKDDYKVDTLDMKRKDWMEYDFSKYDTVFHVAGIAHADVERVSEEVKQMYYRVNTDLAIETAKKAKESEVKQFILMSSMIVYGNIEHITQKTEPNPINFYGDSKWQADKGVRQLEDNNFKVVVVRPPMIYGKGSKGNYPTLAKLSRKMPIFPKINNKRSMIYIDNFCEFIKGIIDKENNGIFFPQNQEMVSTSDIVAEIARVYGHKIFITKLLVPFVIVGKKLPGKVGNMCRKAFGSSYYDQKMSEGNDSYCIYNFESSIKKTEV